MQRLALLLLLAGAQAASADNAPVRISLTQAVERALNASPALEGARRRMHAARAEVAMARAMLGLHVSAGAVAGFSEPDAMLDAAGASGPMPGAMLGRPASAHLVATAMLPIHTGGGLEAQLRRAQAMAAMAEAELASERATVIADVKEGFYRAQYAAAMLRVAEADRDAARAMAENARAEWEAGRGIEASYLRAIARERAAERSIVAAGAERALAIIALARSMGERPDARLEPVEEPSADRMFEDAESAVRAALVSSPMLGAMQQRLAAARQDVVVAGAARRPQVYASFMGGVSSVGGMDRRTSTTAGLTVVLPLLDGGMRREAVRKAEEDRLGAESDVRAARLAVEAEVRMAWKELEAADASLVAARAAVVAAKAAYSVIELRVQNQKAILVEQLDALAAVREAEEALARAQFEQRMALIKIERVTGRK